MRRSIGCLIVAGLLASCSAYKEVELTDITNVEVLKMDASTVALRVDARINNPNGFTIEGFTIVENRDLQTIKR